MSDTPKDALTTRWEALNEEVQSMKVALNGFPLLGVLDRENNHISSMQEEMDVKTRAALMAYWLDKERGRLS